MITYYTDEKNVQILIALLKEHGIRKVIASPGTTNITFVRSLQNDPFFEIYSSVDERSAAYIACGLAAESGEPVVLSCTGATASRNYMPGLTEAYYRKLPILAVTSTQDISSVGHHIAQVLDQSSVPNDIVKHSVQLPLIKDDNDWWSCEVKANKAILELSRHGGGPVHINLATGYSRSFETKELPKVRVIKRITQSSDYPTLPDGRVAVFIGSHAIMTEEQISALENFCKTNGAVVFCDHTSGYKGKYCVIHSLSSSQRLSDFDGFRPDLLIHIGEITGDYSAGRIVGKQIWRISEDGELRDTFRKLQYIFEMPEQKFFEHYSKKDNTGELYLNECNNHLSKLYNEIPELPFSNLWIAKKIHKLIPENSTIHFGILNSLRSWNFFELPKTVKSNSNVGGFGIDGCVSSLIGASLAKKDRLYFGVIGDLAFFYDMNSIGNRHVGNNLRILLVNNGRGTEFRNFNHMAAQFGESADEFTAAGGHFGNKSQMLVKNYSESLGFEYLSASTKAEFEQVYERFLTDQMLDKSILLEVFTNSEDESKALEIITSIDVSTKGKAKDTIKNIIGEKNIRNIKKIIRG
ncbi:MAG: 2-succinyl-5-enolpyruvyl-6-hydroxy-3-cyclohexene-1-carboxylate synthase [Candidatus Cloacimonas sp.]|nr:2-succinyl-5-enolpyruvyl-6-hydroxy-3-cyclohexene-1-carboxylate synthase [Candidatus Cloacimonas sp.]